MTKLFEHMGESSVDSLIAAAYPLADVFHIGIRKMSSEATLKRGTLLDLSTGAGGDNKYVIHGTPAGAGETLIANCILAEDTVVGASADVIGRAYRTGHFVQDKLIIAEGATLAPGAKEALRDVGILLSGAIIVG